jgi:hypothetical protein
MTLSLILGCLWVLASTVTAMLPMRLQYPPGIALLLAAPVLLVWIGYDHGAWAAGLGALALASLFRNPLRYMLARAMGRPPGPPPDA